MHWFALGAPRLTVCVSIHGFENMHRFASRFSVGPFVTVFMSTRSWLTVRLFGSRYTVALLQRFCIRCHGLRSACRFGREFTVCLHFIAKKTAFVTKCRFHINLFTVSDDVPLYLSAYGLWKFRNKFNDSRILIWSCRFFHKLLYFLYKRITRLISLCKNN